MRSIQALGQAAWTKDQSRDGARLRWAAQVSQMTEELPHAQTRGCLHVVSVWIAHVCELSSSLPSSGGAWRVAENRWFWVSFSPGFCFVNVCSCLGRVLETPQSSCRHPRFFLSGVQATRRGRSSFP